jgi:hypothetical protein
MKTNSLILFATVILLCFQCTNEVVTIPCAVLATPHAISYSQEVLPIVKRSCAVPNCHIGGFPKGDFTSYDDLKAKADEGKLYFRLSSGQMPPADSEFPSLSLCDRNIITQWINEGAKNN